MESLMSLSPREVKEKLSLGEINEEQAFDYTVRKKKEVNFYELTPQEVKYGFQQKFISDEEAKRYIDVKESGAVAYYAKETGRGFVHGIKSGVEELNDSANSIKEWVASQLGDKIPPAITQASKNTSLLGAWSPFAEGALSALSSIPKAIDKPSSVYGGLVKGVSQAGVGFAAATAATAALPFAAPAWATRLPKTWNFLTSSAKGAFGDAFAFDPKEARFSNFIEELGWSTPVTRALMADPDDTEAFGRLANALEGLGFGVAAEGAIMGVKWLAKSIHLKSAGDPIAKQKILDEMRGIPKDGEFALPHTKASLKDVDNIMQAMALTESGGRFFDATGKMVVSKDMGAGKWQIMPDTWKDWSTKKWGEVREMSPANQEELVRWRVSQLVEEGYTPQQIASIWNSGRPEWEGKVGVNKWGVTYNVPKHVQRFTDYYNKVMKMGPHRGYASGMFEQVLPQQEADDVMKLLDSWAEAHSKRTGESVQEFYFKQFGDIRTGGDASKVAEGLFHWGGRKATGFQEALKRGKVVVGKDGIQRFDISDVGLKWSQYAESLVTHGKAYKDPELNKRLFFEGTLGEAIEFDELFYNYPHMRDIKFQADIGADQTRYGVYKRTGNDGKPLIMVKAKTMEDALGTLVHEMQHDTQWVEGFPKGGNPDIFDPKTGAFIPEILQKAHKKIEENLMMDPESDVYKIDKELADVRKQGLQMLDPVTHEVKPEFKHEWGVLNQYLDNLKLMRADAIKEYKEVTYKGMTPYQLYLSLFGETEAREVTERFKLRRAGQGELVDALGHLEALSPFERERALILRQGEKGAVQFIEDGRAILHLFATADFSTIVHEVGHMMRRQLDPEDLKNIERWAGVTDGTWAREHEEAFAEAFERYIANGRAPKPELESVFERMKGYMLSVYEAVKNIGKPITREVQDVFDKMLGAERERVKIVVERDVSRGVEILQAIRKILSGEEKYTPNDIKEGGAFNLLRNCTADEVHQVMSKIADLNEEDIEKVTRGVVTRAESKEAGEKLQKRFAGNMGVPVEAAQVLLNKVRNLDAYLNAHMDTLEGWTRAVTEMAKAANTEEAKLEVLQSIIELQRYQTLIKGVQTEVARGLGSLNNMRRGTMDLTKMNPEQLVKARKKLGPKLDRIVNDFAEFKTPVESLSYARKLGRNRILEGLLEYRQASLLSGMGTHVANTLGNTAAIVIESGNRLISYASVGLGEKFSAGETLRFKQGIAYLNGFVKGIVDSLRLSSTGRAALWQIGTFQGDRKALFSDFLADENTGNFWKALFSGEPQLDFYVKYLDTEGHEQSGAIPNWLGGPLIRIPFRLLNAEDELFKGAMYRAELTHLAYEEAISRNLKGQDIDEFVSLYLDVPTPEAHLSALGKAREISFSTPLTGAAGKFSEALNQTKLGLVAKLMFFPFIRVPINMLKFTSDRTIGFLARRNIEDFRAGGVRRAEAVTRLATGNALLAIGAYLYSEGKLTGSAPMSQRNAWENAKIQENSIRYGNKWMSYNRIQPLASFLRIGADLGRIWDSRDLPEEQRDSLLTGAITILSNQLSDAYMKSAAEFVDIFSRPDRMNLEKWLNRQAGTFFPASAAFNQANRGEGELLHEYSPELDLWNSFLGTFDVERLPLRRHNVYGTTIEQEERVALALNVKTVDDPVMLELAKVGANVGRPSRTITVKGSAVKLNDEQYEKYQQLISKLPIREQLEKVINSPSYQMSQDDQTKAQALSRVVSTARQVAKGQLIRGDQEIASELQTQYRTRADAMAGITLNQDPDTQLYHWMNALQGDD